MDGVTKKLWELKPGDRLIVAATRGAASTYKGPGTFLAGGAGASTPFVRDPAAVARADGRLPGHRLIVSNKTERDIILRDEFEGMDGLDHDWLISNDRSTQLYRGRIDEDYLTHHVMDFEQNFYVCGPDRMVADLRNLLGRLGASTEEVTFEK